jgi:hypothetical protein
MVEIHIRLQNTREIYQQNLKEVWRDAVPVETRHATSLQGALRLELSDMLIHACLHLDKHFVTSHVQFTSFNDIFNLLRSIDNGQQTTDNGKRRDVMPHVSNNEQENITDNIETQNIETQSIETQSIASVKDFWERFEAKCIQYNFADTVFRYLVMVRFYYRAPLPDYLYEKYENELTEDDKQRFINHLSGTGNEFIGRGAPTSGTATHLLHLKALKNPVDFMRYVKGVVFPGKQFMIEKYGLVSSSVIGFAAWLCQELRISSQNSELKTQNWKLRFWWLWYGYRWYSGLKGLWLVVTGTSTSSVTIPSTSSVTKK